MWYLIVTGLLLVWIVRDSKARRANVLGWSIGTLLLPVIVVPAYFAARPLKEGEVREGGKGWNLLKNFSIIWTLLMAVAALWGLVGVSQQAPTSDAEQVGFALGTTLGLGMMGAIWFFPVLGALVLGLLVKKSSLIERGPTVAIVGIGETAETNSEEKAMTAPEKRKKSLIPLVCLLAAIAALYFAANKYPSLAENNFLFSFFVDGPSVSRQGYVLNPRESVILSWLLRDEETGFAEGRPTLLAYTNGLIAVSPVEVSNAYEENQVAADQKYYQKPLMLRGVIEGINSGLGNEPYILLRGTNMFLSPQAHFQKQNMERIVTLKKGQKLSLVCDGGGTIAGTPMFKNCLFLDEHATQAIAKMKQQIEDFLAGKAQQPNQSEWVPAMTITAIASARSLPETSTCFTDKSNCLKELGDLFSKDVSKNRQKQMMASVVTELKSNGIQIPDTVVKKIDSMGNKASKNPGQ